MGGIVDSVVDVFDVATFGVTGIGAVAGSDVTGVGSTIKSATNSVFGEGQEASNGLNPFFQESAVGKSSFNPATGEIFDQLSPELQGLFDSGVGNAATAQQGILSAGQQSRDLGSGFLSEAAEFDPFAAAETQFNRLDAILEPNRTRSRSSAVSSLLSAGRLGGTSGNRVQAEIEGEIENQRMMMLNDQFSKATSVQDSLVSKGVTLNQAADSQQQNQQALSSGFLSDALGIDSQLQSQLALGSNMTKTAATAREESGFQSILRGGATAGLGALIGAI